MLKCVFIGRKNDFNAYMADWLAARTQLQAIVWGDQGRRTWRWRYSWLRRSVKKNGWIATVDAILFKLRVGFSREMREGWARLIADVEAVGPDRGAAIGVPQTHTVSINSPEIEQLLTRLKPDIVFVVCLSELISNRILRIPHLGTHIYHEGLTPEYRGVHSPLWAIANGDDDKVGFTLLHADNKFDGGDVDVQGVTQLDPMATSIGYVGHWALYEGLPHVARFLDELERGEAKPLDVSGRRDGYYSYFRLSQWRKIQRRRKSRGLKVKPTAVMWREDGQPVIERASAAQHSSATCNSDGVS